MKVTAIVMLALMFSIWGCSDDSNTSPQSTKSELTLNISGLTDLGANAKYEGWLISPDGKATSTGVFTVDANGKLNQTKFEVDATELKSAKKFVLTIEPNPDPDPKPSSIHILAGDFNNNSSNLTISHPAALNNTFADVSGKFILATPTNGSDNDENSGIWFLDLSSGSPMQGLNLPVLPDGWKYEGWVVINGIPVSTGTFINSNSSDDAAPYSGTMSAPPFPGEDFLVNSPSGLSFPTNIAGGTAVISIEPFPDNSPSPFLLKPLVSKIPSDAKDHFNYSFALNLDSFPTGTATR